MKQLQLLAILIMTLLLSNNLVAQDMDLSLNLGMTPSTTSPGDLYFSYVDESPSQDNLQSERTIEQSKRAFTIGGTIGFKLESNAYFRFGLEGMLGKISGFEFNFGGGYEVYNNDKFNIKPLLMFSYGSAGLKLGDIYQNDVYIEVNRTQFYSESVAVRLDRTHFIAHPEVEFGMPVSSSTEITLNVGYQIPLSIKTSKLIFSGQDENGQDVTAKESIFASNVYLSLNGHQIRSNFIGVSGLAIRAGIKFNL